MKIIRACIFTILALTIAIDAEAAANELLLRENLRQATPGDYLVTAQNKNYTLLLMGQKKGDLLAIEEITVPAARISKEMHWKNWVENRAPGHTSWVYYEINLATGAIQQAFSFTKRESFTIPQAQNFLSTLLNLRLQLIPEKERKKVGPPPSSDSADRRSVWQPALVVDGKRIPGVAFDGWRTRWPKDSSDLSGKVIEVYLPKENSTYPSYFPYWMQISGIIGKAKVRIVDSGMGLHSPMHLSE